MTAPLNPAPTTQNTIRVSPCLFVFFLCPYRRCSRNPAGYWLSNLGLDYKLGNMGQYIHGAGFVQNLVFSFTVTNLTNQLYISTMGEGGNPIGGASAYSYQSFLIGAPRQFFGSVRAEF